MAAVDDGAFSEVCLVGVTKKGGSEVQFASYIELDSISPKQGAKDISTANMASGARRVKRTPQADNEVTVKLYEIEIGAAASLQQLFNGNTDATAPLASVNTHKWDLFRLAFLWTDDTTAATAGGTTASGSYALRDVFSDLRMTNCEVGVEDGTRIVNVTFKGPAFGTTGTGKYEVQSVKSSDIVGLSTLGSYS